MKQLPHRVCLALTAPLLVACAASAPTVSAQSTAPADSVRRSTAAMAAPLPAEDVSKYRTAAATTPPKPAPLPTAAGATLAPKPAFVAPTNQANDRLEQRLRDQAFTNQNVKYTQGYRILAYVGLEREKAMAIRREVISRYPEETDYMTFKQPVYRLYIGDYTTKLEAARGMMHVRPLAPKAELEAASVVLNKIP